MIEPAEAAEAAAGDPIVSLDELRGLARQRLPRDVFDYLDGGAGRETSLRDNQRDLDSIKLLPLVMRDVSSPDLGTILLGERKRWPIGFSPTALHRLVHPEAEVASARAARQLQVPLAISAMSSVTIEQIARDSGHDDLWFQTYVFKDRSVAPALAARAEAAGCKALVVTVGCPVMGSRDRNLRNRFVLPPGVSPAHFRRVEAVNHNNPLHSFSGAEIDAGASWEDIGALGRDTALPLVVKGIMNPADVQPALDVGAAAIVVSNHGGRQLDSTSSTIRALPAIAAALDGRASLLVDSGFRRGTDVLKAIALGADSVLLGRPLLWALAAGGPEAVVTAIELLAAELQTSLQLAGCRTIAELRRDAGLILRLPGASAGTRSS